MNDPQLAQVADGIRQLDATIDSQEDPEKLRKIAHAGMATALKALEDADLARSQSERSYRRGFADGAGQEHPPEAKEPEEVAGGQG